MDSLNMDVVYSIYANNDHAERLTASEVLVSTISVIENIPDVNVHYCICDNRFDFLSEFIDNVGINVIRMNHGERAGYISKLLCFRHVLDELNRFVMFDTDTIIKRDFSNVQEDIPELCFSAYHRKLVPMKPDMVKFFKRFYSFKYPQKPCAAIVSVNKKNKRVWRRFKRNMDEILDIYRKKIVSYSKTPGELDCSNDDEPYYSFTIQHGGGNPRDFVAPYKVFSSGSSKYVEHKKSIRLHSGAIDRYKKFMKKNGLDPSFFTYRGYPK